MIPDTLRGYIYYLTDTQVTNKYSETAKTAGSSELQKANSTKHQKKHQTRLLPGSSSVTHGGDGVVEDLRVVSSYCSTTISEKTPGIKGQDSTLRHTGQSGPVRLEQIRSSVFEFLSERHSAHEYTVPRLFVVLPDDDNSSATSTTTTAAEANGVGAAGVSPSSDPRYRLYFLCECSASFTLPLGSGLNHLHIAKHEGYLIDPDRQDEFFKRYGAMVLMLLYYLKYGHDPSESVLSSSEESSQTAAVSHKQRQGQGVQQNQLQQQSISTEEAGWRKVRGISDLRRSDFPDSIAHDPDTKFDRMIKFLENLRGVRLESTEYTPTDHHSNENYCEKQEMKVERKEDIKLHGLVSLSDLHHLYSFLGIANINNRIKSGQLGNLYRISNVRGQVSWVCVYHYRWTFLERNIDEFESWVVARRGHFDKQSGSVSVTLVSRAHTRIFCSWIVNKMAPSLVEAHIKLGWNFGKRDLWRLAKALAGSTVTVLSLDGCSYREDSTYRGFHKKYDPILFLLTQGQLHSLELLRLPSLFKRLSSKTIKVTSLRRLELGRGMNISLEDRRALTYLLTSCISLQELVLSGFNITDQHLHAIISGIRETSSLNTLDLSNSQLDDSSAFILAQGLYNTQISQLDLSKNESLSDTSAARIIRAIGPRLTSLKMAQTGFGDLAAAALAKSMDGISFSNTLQNQLVLQSRLDIAAIAAGHRAGIRFGGDHSVTSMSPRLAIPIPQTREKTHLKGNLIYLDIEDNQCTEEGFEALAKVKSRLYFIYLNLSGSKGLRDKACAQILDRVASPAMVTLRLACTGFGSLSAKSLANAILTKIPTISGVYTEMSGPCQLEELDLQACPIDSKSFSILCDALSRSQALSYIKVMDVGHCGNLEDQQVQKLLKTILVPNGTAPPLAEPAAGYLNRPTNPQSMSAIPVTTTASNRHGGSFTKLSQDNNGSSSSNSAEDPKTRLYSLSKSDSNLTSQVGNVDQRKHPLQESVIPIAGFFTNLRQLDLKSTQIGDKCAWLLAQALVQTTTMLTSLTVLDPAAMTIQGICWIIDAMCENSTVLEFGIGKSDPEISLAGLELFGFGLINLLETNKTIGSLTILGAPLGPIAKGLLLNQTLHSIYLIRSKGQFEDIQLMGQALACTRSLLVFWMGGSDESLLGPLHRLFQSQQGPEDPQNQDTLDEESHSFIANSSTSSQQQQFEQHQKLQEEQQHQNMYRDFHLLHNQDNQHQLYQQHRLKSRQQHSKRQQKHKQQNSDHQSAQHTLQTFGGYLPKEISSALKSAFVFRSKRPPAQKDRSEANSIYGANATQHPTTGVFGTNNGGGGGNMSMWIRNPIIEGIRRNHSLIKVTLDSIALSSSNINRPSSANTKAKGIGDTGISRSSTWNNGVSQELSTAELRQLHHQQQHQMYKKVNANRKALMERSRVGWEELKLLGVDDDIIEEICQE
ncbi:hypothetical protein BGZ49_007559 [Haplosporangium sp. Z 27]|nr:hypothetical protein BGZ49_007559 [Haplosporangium sp. Z 27]